MTSTSLNLSTVQSLTAALERMPNGRDLQELSRRLGLWTSAYHNAIDERQPFPARFSQLSEPEISDLASFWISEAGRITELVGLLNGIESQIKIMAKAARARARASARRTHAATAQAEDKKAKAPTISELNDLAEDDPTVMDIDQALGVVHMLLATASAAKEATFAYRDSISREITFRTEQMKARLYG